MTALSLQPKTAASSSPRKEFNTSLFLKIVGTLLLASLVIYFVTNLSSKTPISSDELDIDDTLNSNVNLKNAKSSKYKTYNINEQDQNSDNIIENKTNDVGDVGDDDDENNENSDSPSASASESNFSLFGPLYCEPANLKNSKCIPCSIDKRKTPKNDTDADQFKASCSSTGYHTKMKCHSLVSSFTAAGQGDSTQPGTDTNHSDVTILYQPCVPIYKVKAMEKTGFFLFMFSCGIIFLICVVRLGRKRKIAAAKAKVAYAY